MTISEKAGDPAKNPMPYASWLYVSTSLIPADQADAEVDRIAVASRSKNAKLDVTGALLFTGTRFVQLLEGPIPAVARLQISIFNDKRHHQVITVCNHDVRERKFSDWFLAYAGSSPTVGKMVEDGVAESELDPSEGARNLIQILRTFART